MLLFRWFWSFALILLYNNNSNVSAQRFLREGFTNQMGSEARNEMKLDDSDTGSGLTREMFLLKDLELLLHPVSFDQVSDAKLRRHLESFLKLPVTMKLKTRNGKYGFRAVGELPSGKRVRAFWRQARVSYPGKTSEFLETNYDDAVRSRLSILEFELQLPPINKKSKQLPLVIYSVAVEPGTMNAKSIIPRGAGTLRVIPDGHGPARDQGNAIHLGKSYVSLPMKAGLVDVGWSKGRPIFRQGRPNGTV